MLAGLAGIDTTFGRRKRPQRREGPDTPLRHDPLSGAARVGRELGPLGAERAQKGWKGAQRLLLSCL